MEERGSEGRRVGGREPERSRVTSWYIIFTYMLCVQVYMHVGC